MNACEALSSVATSALSSSDCAAARSISSSARKRVSCTSSGVFMGRSFSVGGWGWSHHFTGLDRPAPLAITSEA